MIRVKRNGKLLKKTEEIRSAIRDYILPYWGDLKSEKFFAIPYWQLKNMIETSSSKVVALRGQNIADKERIDADWVRVLKRYAADDILERASSKEAVEFFLTAEEFERMEAGVKKEYADNWQKAIFIARIGKDGDEFVCVYNICEFSVVSVSIGGNGAALGVKIPAG